MNKQELLSNLKEASQELSTLTENIAKSPSMQANGTLMARTVNGKLRLFRRVNGSKEEYLGRKDCRSIILLATKTYAQKLDKAAKLQKSQIDGCIELLQSKRDKNGNDIADIDLVYNSLPEHIRTNTTPSAATDDGFAEAWQKKDYGKLWSKSDRTSYETTRGEKVRSKSEWIIASMLAEAGVPYRYEAILALSPEFRVFTHPDFTVLNKRTRKVYYWEHFGLMSDPNYINNTYLPKIAEYYNFNFLPGDKLLMTFESSERPLDTLEVKRLIEKYLL